MRIKLRDEQPVTCCSVLRIHAISSLVFKTYAPQWCKQQVTSKDSKKRVIDNYSQSNACREGHMQVPVPQKSEFHHRKVCQEAPKYQHF